MKARATIRLSLQSEKQLNALVTALTPEVHKKIGARSQATLMQEQLSLVLNVEAEDTVALRAALNAYLHWINSTINVIETVVKAT
jgi:tRNA threonylcarbamoyladenosine modification (KEOPS) complex  Pcc1 subunit